MARDPWPLRRVLRRVEFSTAPDLGRYELECGHILLLPLASRPELENPGTWRRVRCPGCAGDRPDARIVSWRGLVSRALLSDVPAIEAYVAARIGVLTQQHDVVAVGAPRWRELELVVGDVVPEGMAVVLAEQEVEVPDGA